MAQHRSVGALATPAPARTRTSLRGSRGAAWPIVTPLGLALVVIVVLAVGIGPVPLAPGTVLAVVAERLGGPAAGVDPTQAAIVWEVRLPRALLGVVVGAGLAGSGAVLQGLVRNILADPYILGISGGASTGAAAAILFGLGAGMGALALPVSAFLGAMVACLAVALIARVGGRVTSLRLLLSGVAVGYALSAATSFLVFLSDSAEGSRSVMFWLLGSLSQATWGPGLVAVWVVVPLGLAALAVAGPRLDALAMGDETAQGLGVAPAATRMTLMALVSLLVGAVVAVSGAIGFVGLVVPHLARRLVGARHSRAIPTAALLGAVFVVLADIVARVLLPPRELPIGILTAMVGAPFLLVLVRRMHARHG